MKYVLSLIAIVIIAASAALPASATNRWVYNNTVHCVWFTIDTADLVTPYRNQAAKYIKAHESHLFNVGDNRYLKVRAEPRMTNDCNTPKIGDVEITEAGTLKPPGPSETTLTGGGRQPFRISWGKQ